MVCIAQGTLLGQFLALTVIFSRSLEYLNQWSNIVAHPTEPRLKLIDFDNAIFLGGDDPQKGYFFVLLSPLLKEFTQTHGAYCTRRRAFKFRCLACLCVTYVFVVKKTYVGLPFQSTTH